MKFPFYLLVLSIILSFQISPNNQEILNQPRTKNPPLTVLENKCNTCHLKRKRVVFTEQNMTQQAPKIHEQVFIKQRMPKGKKNKLTAKEIQILKDWLIKTSIDFSKK